MQKKILALAIAGLASSAVFAQSNVTIYGRVDYGYMSRGNGDGLHDVDGTKGEMASGMQAGSRLGFKGTEDLGNGLKAIWQLEQGITNDSNGTNVGAAAPTNDKAQIGIFSRNTRNAFIGLTGNWGTVVGGRLDGVRYGVYNKYDAFAGGGMGNFTQMTAQVDRADNAIAYVSPTWSGFSFVLAHSFDTTGQEQAGSRNDVGGNASTATSTNANAGDGRLYTIKGGYENGPISFDAGYETVRYTDSNDAPAATNILDNEVVYYVAGSYDFGFMKVRALWDHHEAESSNNWSVNPLINELAEYDAWFLSASVPYGNFLFKATYGQVSDKLNATERAKSLGAIEYGDATKWGLGVNYNLSKRTNVYFDYGHISNDKNANHSLSPAANSVSTSSGLIGNGYGTRGWNVGLAHNF